MVKKEFYFPSEDGKTQIHGIEWIPEGEVKGVLQICHGMAEYIGRYDEFAKFLQKRGYYVVGHDHLGHGLSVTSEVQLGFFHETKGNICVIEDIHHLRKIAQEKYPKIPYFMLGHSMGSFLLRQYIGMYGEKLDGVVVMGTGNQSDILLKAGMVLCRMLALLKGWNYRSQLVDYMAFGGFNKKFKRVTDGSGWLSRNPVNVKTYKQDPLCSFIFTVNAYYHMFAGIRTAKRQERAGKIPLTLPVFFVSGQEDPVGNFGKDVEKVYKIYRKCGLHDVSMKLYLKDRHEILNEIDKQIVFEDIYQWLKQKNN